jgi:spermidine synthase
MPSHGAAVGRHVRSRFHADSFLRKVTACRRSLACCLVLAAMLAPRPAAGAANRTPRSLGAVEFDKESEYSHIRVRKQGSVQTLLFVRDRGEEVVQSMVNLKKPYELLCAYSRSLFASYLLQPRQQRVLIVGLGGGAMIHFLKHYDPEVKIDALEIDPVVVQVADRYFDVRSEGNVNIVTTDGVRYLERTKERYDVIYMDAFLKPSADTDPTGKPLAMKTQQFYKEMQKRLNPRGVVVFNVNPHQAVDADLRAIRAAFGQSYVFHTADTNIIVLATASATRQESAALRLRAKQLDQRFHATFSFQDVLKGLAR